MASEDYDLENYIPDEPEEPPPEDDYSDYDWLMDQGFFDQPEEPPPEDYYSDYDWLMDQGAFDQPQDPYAGLEDLGDGYFYDPADGSVFDAVTGEWFVDEPAPDQPEQITYDEFLQQQAAQQQPAAEPETITYDEYLRQLAQTDRAEYERLVNPWFYSPDPRFNQDPRSQGPLEDVSWSAGSLLPTTDEFIFYIRQDRAGDPPLAGDPRYSPDYTRTPDAVIQPVPPPLPPKPETIFDDPQILAPPEKPAVLPPPVVRPPPIVQPLPIVQPPPIAQPGPIIEPLFPSEPTAPVQVPAGPGFQLPKPKLPASAPNKALPARAQGGVLLLAGIAAVWILSRQNRR